MERYCKDGLQKMHCQNKSVDSIDIRSISSTTHNVLLIDISLVEKGRLKSLFTPFSFPQEATILHAHPSPTKKAREFRGLSCTL